MTSLLKRLPFYQIFSIQSKEFVRDPGVLFWALGFPLAMAAVLGFAFSGGAPKAYTVAVVTDSLSPSQRTELEERLSRVDSSRFTLLTPASVEEARLLIQRGRIAFYVLPVEGELTYHFDPANEQSLLAYYAFRESLTENKKSPLVPLTASGQRYIDFLIPGLLAMGVMNSALWGSGWTLIEYRMKKLLRRMAATPMRKGEFFLGHLFTRLVLSLVESLFLWGFSWWIFDVEFRGSLQGLFLVVLAGNICFNGIAILMASRTDNSRIGNGLINAISLPMMLLSGIFFSYENFPSWAVDIIRYLPLTLLADSLRSLFVEGADLVSVLLPSALLIVSGLLFFRLGLRIFRWS